jgi:hypothetical protein
MGPKTIQGIVETHKKICDEAAALLERVDRGEGEKLLACARQYYRQRNNCNLQPTYPAVLIVMDGYLRTERNQDCYIYLSEQSKRQTVLLVSTGENSHLYDPVDFEILKKEGACLPLDRGDNLPTGMDMVRVFLSVAVRFVADLGLREDKALPRLKRDYQWERKANEWADDHLGKADRMESIKNSILGTRWIKWEKGGGEILMMMNGNIILFSTAGDK